MKKWWKLQMKYEESRNAAVGKLHKLEHRGRCSVGCTGDASRVMIAQPGPVWTYSDVHFSRMLLRGASFSLRSEAEVNADDEGNMK